MSARGPGENAIADWIGRQEVAFDVIDPRPMRLMQATLDHPVSVKPGAALPPLWHWLYFSCPAPQKTIGADGHPQRGDFLPPVALPRRMWAGGRLTFERALRIAESVQKTSTIKDIKTKHGRSGELCFVTVNNAFHVNGEFRLAEEHDIVYRGNPVPGAQTPEPQPAPDAGDWQRLIEPDPVLLFRYSALTFNAHRIHYDRPYCLDVEGYPGLVFHGPLTATLLIGLVRENIPGAWISEFRYRAVSPLFDTAPFTIAGRRDGDSVELWACNHEGGLAMKAMAVLS